MQEYALSNQRDAQKESAEANKRRHQAIRILASGRWNSETQKLGTPIEASERRMIDPFFYPLARLVDTSYGQADLARLFEQPYDRDPLLNVLEGRRLMEAGRGPALFESGWTSSAGGLMAAA